MNYCLITLGGVPLLTCFILEVRPSLPLVIAHFNEGDENTCFGSAAGDSGVLSSNLLLFTSSFVSLGSFLSRADRECDLHKFIIAPNYNTIEHPHLVYASTYLRHQRSKKYRLRYLLLWSAEARDKASFGLVMSSSMLSFVFKSSGNA